MPHRSLLPSLLGDWVAYASVIEPRWFQISRVEVSPPRWPAALDGFTILQLSDFHSRRFGSAESFVQGLSEALPTPDLLAVTGDFAESEAGLEACFRGLSPLAARHGKFAVLGNNDYQPHRKRLRLAACLAEQDYRLLEDEAVTLDLDGHGLAIGGLRFYFVRRSHHRFAYPVGRIFESLPPDLPRLLLSHTPEALPEAALAGVDLVLAGHTHGGQVCLPGGRAVHHNMSRAATRHCERGLHHWGRTAIYVTRGLGVSTVPMRFWSRPEAVWLTLRCGTGTARS